MDRKERFKEIFMGLSDDEKISLFREYCAECMTDEQIYDFDGEFFANYLPDPMDAARRTHFGNIQSWADPYITFDGYGNLKSLSESDAAALAEDYVYDIYENEDIWGFWTDFQDIGEEEDDE